MMIQGSRPRSTHVSKALPILSIGTASIRKSKIHTYYLVPFSIFVLFRFRRSQVWRMPSSIPSAPTRETISVTARYYYRMTGHESIYGRSLWYLDNSHDFLAISFHLGPIMTLTESSLETQSNPSSRYVLSSYPPTYSRLVHCVRHCVLLSQSPRPSQKFHDTA